MRKKIFIPLVVALCASQLHAQHVISFFMRQLPSMADMEYTQNLADKLEQPGKIDKALLNALMAQSGASGIFATYAGYLAVSNAQGQVVLPRKHDNPIFYFIITDQITPIIIAKNTVAHWQLLQGVPTSMFKVEKKFDADSNTYFWQTTTHALPTDNIIPTNAIVIIAKPKDIYVPLGITISDNNPNLQMPDIFVRPGIAKATNALYLLTIKNFFSPIALTYKKEATHYSSQLTSE